MEVFRAPRVTLIARPEFLEPEHLRVQWQGSASAGERLAEFAGRICYMSQHNPANRSTADYLENIKKQGHGSVLEHAVYVLLIEGISRSCSHELVRHRAGFGYSQLSQRYVDESHASFVVPPAMLGDPALESEWEREMADAQAAYVRAVEALMQRYAWIADKMHRRKVPREPARTALPNPTDGKSGLFCRRLPETTCESVSHTTKHQIPRPTLNPTVPVTRSPSGTTHLPSRRWSRRSVSSAPSSGSKPISSFLKSWSSHAPISSSTWRRGCTARAAKPSSPQSAST